MSTENRRRERGTGSLCLAAASGILDMIHTAAPVDALPEAGAREDREVPAEAPKAGGHAGLRRPRRA